MMVDLLVSMLWGLLILCVMCFGMLPYFGGKYWQKVRDSSKLVLRLCMEWLLPSLLSRIPGLKHYFGSISQQKLLFVPDADNNPDVEHEISDPALFRFLLNEETLNQFDEPEAKTTQKLSVLKDIDKESQIVEFEIHRTSMHSAADSSKAFHVFIVFKSTSETDGDYWWSLEKNTKYIVLQRSRKKNNVKDKLEGKQRNKVKLIKEDLKGKGTIQDLFATFWDYEIIKEKYHILDSNCQSLVTFVSKQMTQEQYDFKGFFPYSPPESDRDKEMLDSINILTSVTDWHPIFTLIYVENTRLFDMIIKGGEYNMLGITQYGLAPLQLAICNSKTKMVQHLLNPPYSADPTTCDHSGYNALHLATAVTHDTKIIDLLLAHSKVHKASKEGSNEETDDSTAVDKDAAAGVLTAQKVKGTGNVNIPNDLGWTLLHCAASQSNAIIAEHLIRQDADLHCRDNNDRTPLHVAAFSAKDMKIIDVLLKNIRDEEINQYKEDTMLLCYAYCNVQHKLGEEIVDRLNQKGIARIQVLQNPKVLDELNAIKQILSNEHGPAAKVANLLKRVEANMAKTDRGQHQPNPHIQQSTFEQIREMKMTRKAEVGSIAHTIGDDSIKTEDKVGQMSQTALRLAIEDSDVEKVRSLFKEFGADFISKATWGEMGANALHLASFYAKTTDLIEFIRKTGKFDINGVDNEGVTPLHCAIRGSNAAINARYLLKKGADPTIGDNKGITPFHLAAAYLPESDILDFIMANNNQFDIDHRNQSRMTALHMAILKSNTATARYLLKMGANINVAGENGWTPLHVAAQYAKDMDIVELLLNHKDADVNNLDNYGYSALDYAMRNEHGLGVAIAVKMGNKGGRVSPTALYRAIVDSDEESVSVLLKNGADISSVRGEYGNNALHVASHYAKTTELIDAILETGKFDINGGDLDGRTPLHFALVGSNAISARRLLEKGADLSISDNKGITPFHLAAAFSRESDIRVLFLANNKEFDIEHRNKSGMTALHMAVMESNTATAEFLLSKGANPNVTDQHGYTPLHVAAKYAKDMNIVNLLLNHKDMNVNYLDNEGNNALHYAMDNEHGLVKEIANLLRGKMAAKSEGSRPNEPKKIATLVPDSLEEDSYIETIRFLIENGQDISALTWGEYEGNALHVASLKAKTTELIDVVRETGKFDINGVDSDGNTPLHYAILGSNATSARYLLEKRADPTRSDNNGITPFHLAAAFSRKTDILGLFLANNKQFDIDHRNQSGMTALHMAIKHSNKVTAEFLLTNGANPNAADRNGLTPLHAAAKYAKDMNMVELLVNHKDVNVNYLDNSGLKALDYTPTNLYGICKQIAKRLREKGEKATDGINQPKSIPARLDAITNSNVKTTHILKENRLDNATWGENGTNALHVAAADAKTTDVIDALLETEKFDINGVDNDGDTPLHYAIMGSNSAKNVPHLIRLGANPIIANKTKVTPLHLAAKNEETTELIDIILETGQCNINTAEAIAAVNPVDNDGRTPLHYAIKRPDPVTINARRLIKMGADPGIADKNGVTPLHMAARNAESMDLIEILLNTGAVDVNCVDNQGRIPLACARDNKHGLGQRIIARLKESGAKE